MPMPEPPYRVRTAGCIDREAWHSTPGTRGDDLMLTAFVAGRGVYRGPDGDIPIVAGMVGLVPPDRRGVLMADPRDPYLHYYTRFAGRYATAVAGAVLAAAPARFFPSAAAAAVADALRRMGRLHRDELPAEVGQAEALLAEALAALRTAMLGERQAPTLTAATLEDDLRAHVHEPTDLGAIAARFGVSRTTLCRRARDGLGIGVQRLHERFKMDWAARLLAHGLTVGECARRVGYADRRYFARVFRKHHGRPPSGWARVGRASRAQRGRDERRDR
ncbi:MAG TPA: AraC family transcriptional regulator [Planctomycetota bacterium]|nr:AraC family transcriptional regulator [Planctomycetota bacterium]